MFVIAWLGTGVVMYILLQDVPSSSVNARKNSWVLEKVWQRVLARLSMIFAGPLWLLYMLSYIFYKGLIK